MNQLVTPDWVMKEGTRRLVNVIKFGGKVNRTYDSKYKVAGARVGNTVQGRLPVKYLVTEGAGFQGQDSVEQTVDIAITDQLNVGLVFGSESLTLQVDMYRERYLEPAFDALANKVDQKGLEKMAKATFYNEGTPGVVPGSTGTLPQAATDAYLDIGVKLDNGAVPPEKRTAMLTPAMHRYLVGGTYTLFNPAMTIAKNYRTGQFGHDQLGIAEFYKTQNVYRHTIGPLGGTPLVNVAGQSGASIVTDGWTAAAAKRLNAGDKITFDGVYQVNPLTYQSTGDLMDFTVTADVYSDASGNATIPISPAIVGPGSPYQNVDALPDNDAAVLIFGHASSHANKTTPQALVYHPDAYALVCADLEKPEGLWMAERVRSKAFNIAFRVLKDYDIRTDDQLCRLDLLCGWAAVRPELGGVVNS